MSNTATSAISDRDGDEVTLDGVLGYLDRTYAGDARLREWFRALRTSGGDLCLQCSTADGARFYRWRPDGLQEVDRQMDATFGPRTAGPVRMQATIDSAETLALVPAAATPFTDF
jgi:hypothetical protein